MALGAAGVLGYLLAARGLATSAGGSGVHWVCRLRATGPQDETREPRGSSRLPADVRSGRRIVADPFAQPDQHQRGTPRRAEPCAARNSGGLRRVVALAGDPPACERSRHPCLDLAGVLCADRCRPVELSGSLSAMNRKQRRKELEL